SLRAGLEICPWRDAAAEGRKRRVRGRRLQASAAAARKRGARPEDGRLYAVCAQSRRGGDDARSGIARAWRQEGRSSVGGAPRRPQSDQLEAEARRGHAAHERNRELEGRNAQSESETLFLERVRAGLEASAQLPSSWREEGSGVEVKIAFSHLQIL